MTERDDWSQRASGSTAQYVGAPARSTVVEAPALPAQGGGQQEPVQQTERRSPVSQQRSTGRGARRAKLTLRRIDPWSAMKFSLVLSVVLFIVWIVAVALLYGLLTAMGVFSKVNESIVQFTGTNSANIESIISAKTVLTSAIVVGLVDIVLFTALATLFAVIYNLCADLAGGVEVTLAEGD